MVVTSSRLHAVRYKLAFDRYIAETATRIFGTLVAFSGTVKDPDTGMEYTEPGMNTDIVTGKPISETHFRSGSIRRIIRFARGRTNTRQVSISHCCTRCMWTSGSTAFRRCRRCRA